MIEATLKMLRKNRGFSDDAEDQRNRMETTRHNIGDNMEAMLGPGAYEYHLLGRKRTTGQGIPDDRHEFPQAAAGISSLWCRRVWNCEMSSTAPILRPWRAWTAMPIISRI